MIGRFRPFDRKRPGLSPQRQNKLLSNGGTLITPISHAQLSCFFSPDADAGKSANYDGPRLISTKQNCSFRESGGNRERTKRRNRICSSRLRMKPCESCVKFPNDLTMILCLVAAKRFLVSIWLASETASTSASPKRVTLRCPIGDSTISAEHSEPKCHSLK